MYKQLQPIEKCFYFSQGRCRFGEQCRYSHLGFKEFYLIRHAQSKYNSKCDQFPGQGFQSPQAKLDFQFNRNMIDCGLTQQGRLQASSLVLPSECYKMKKMKSQYTVQQVKYIDLVFVSPLNRALESCSLILEANQVKANKVKVLPELSEVLSKICDFSVGMDEKVQKYKSYDFSAILGQEKERLQEKEIKQKKEKFIKKEKDAKQALSYNEQFQHFWQDSFVDPCYESLVQYKNTTGERYCALLEKLFPTPLENSKRCFERAMSALTKIYQIVESEKAQKVLIVSHNRILKYIIGRNNEGRGPSFENCEIKKILI